LPGLRVASTKVNRVALLNQASHGLTTEASRSSGNQSCSHSAKSGASRALSSLFVSGYVVRAAFFQFALARC
jgi:hypothetical protein